MLEKVKTTIWGKTFGQLQILQFTFNKNDSSYQKFVDNILSVDLFLYL